MLFKKIPELSTLSTVTANDQIVIYGVGSSTTGKATLASAIKQGGFVPSTQSSTAGINKIINQHYGARLIHDGSNDWIYHVTVGQEGYDIGVKEGVNLVAEKPDYDLGDWIKNKLSLDQNGLSANLNFGNINITTTEGNVLTSIQGSPSTFRGSVQTPHAAGYKTDVYGNPQHSSTDNTNIWCIKNNAGSAVFQVNYQTGAIKQYNDDTSWVSCPVTGTGTLIARRYHGLVFLEGSGLKPTTTWSVITESLPQKYVPQRSTRISGWHNSYGRVHMTILISTTGQIQISTQTAGTAADGYFNAVYIPAS